MNKINIEKVIDYSNILKENEKLKLEIERLNKGRETDIKYNKYLQKEVVKVNSIIKEAREYIKGNKDKMMPIWGSEDYDYETCLFEEDIKKLLEILDKVGSDKE